MSTQPLLAGHRPSSQHSDELAAAEDEALLASQAPSNYSRVKSAGFWREFALFIWAVLATAGLIILAVIFQHSRNGHKSEPTAPSGKRNLVFMVSDGMGPASLSLTRSFRQHIHGLPIDDILTLDEHLIGSSRTRSANSLVTDSAAGATAFSCGLKSYNGAISMLPDFTPCGTVLEAAKKAGYMTGLVVKTDITDATPACFASHVKLRTEEDDIASQEVGEHPLGRVVDIMLGGGRCHFLPNSTVGSCRADDRDIVALAKKEYGWTYVDDRDGFDSLQNGHGVKLPLMGLFAPTDIPFEIDRRNMNDVYPSLDEMAQVALTALEAATKDSDKGFFLMIEGSRIDHAGHANDPAAQVHEVLEYDKTFSQVLQFIEKSETQTVVVSTSDHETGGLSVARQLNAEYPEYLWLPQVLANASHSGLYLGHTYHAYLRSDDSTDPTKLEKYLRKTIIKEGLGITNPTDDEVKLLIEYPEVAHYILADMVSRRAQIGWSSHGHSAVDVNIYGSKGTEKLRGNHENTDVGKFLRDYLDVSVEEITKELQKNIAFFNLDEKAVYAEQIDAAIATHVTQHTEEQIDL